MINQRKLSVPENYFQLSPKHCLAVVLVNIFSTARLWINEKVKVTNKDIFAEGMTQAH
jgi:hypothetical protein